VGHPDRPGFLSNLAGVLRARFERTGVPTDVDAAIEADRAAVDAAPPTILTGPDTCRTWGMHSSDGSNGPG
jgi:hypothetical protein